MRAKITKRSVDLLKCWKRSDQVLWDTELHGFGIRVRRTGAKTYILQYRVGGGRNGRLRKFTIGRHGSPWTPAEARKKAQRLLGEIAAGEDPADSRRQVRDAMTVAELCAEYLNEGIHHKKASTVATDRARMRLHIEPLLGSKRVHEVTRADVERLFIDAKVGKTACKGSTRHKTGSIATGGLGVAAQCVALLSVLMNFAVARGMRLDNPARGVKKPPTRKMERFLSEQEISRLAAALDGESGSMFAAAAIRLLMFTGCRKGEIQHLLWQHVDFEQRCLRLPDSKTGSKVIYLNAPALEILSGFPRVDGNEHVIAGAGEQGICRTIDKVWQRVRARAGLSDVRIHDLRHSYASVGAIGGLSLPIIGALLGHKHATTTARYAHLSAHPLRAANEAIGMRIMGAMRAGQSDEQANDHAVHGLR